MRIFMYFGVFLAFLAVVWLLNLAFNARRIAEMKKLRKQRDASNALLDEVLDVAHRNREIDPHTAPVIIDEIIPKRRELNQ